jgi:hypothetical protein
MVETKNGEINQLWWVALGIVITAFAFESSRKWGPWVLIFTVITMLVYAQEKGRL